MTSRISVPLIDHRLSPDALRLAIATAETRLEEELATIAGLPDEKRTFGNTVEALEQAVAAFGDAGMRLGILKEIHTDAAVRDAAAEVDELMGQTLVRVASRRDLYQAVKSWLEGGRMEPLDDEQKRLLELMLRDFRRNGLELSDDDLAKLVELRTRMTTLSTQFQKHLNENVDAIEVTEAELEGVPEAVASRLEKTPGGRRVTTKYPDYVPFMENARSGEARRRLFVAFNSREAERNLPILTEVIRLRDQAAKLLGYPTHADYVTEDRMAKSAENVANFLNSLRDRLRSRRDEDYRRLLLLKREETGDENARLEPWDVSYYLNQLRKRELSLDTESIREFFPLETVLSGMFEVYETILGITLREQPNADVWAPGVKLYEILDAKSGELLASFYTDLHPRPGKYGHAAVAPLNVPRQTGLGYHRPMVVLLGNFTPPSDDRPSLLTHDEVRTVFHEFGHVMHQTLTTARYGSQAGFNVAGDFVEAPSQMLENWVFRPEVLERMSGHYKEPSRKLPAETVERLQRTRTFDAGYRYTRQVFLATFDQALHVLGPEVDVQRIDRQLYRDILGMEPVAEACFAASFGHLLGGYDAGYYGYLWSEVFAADLFTRFEESGVLNEEVGRDYRDVILAKGRSVEADELMEQFLGRPQNDAAFLRQIGVS